MVHRHAMQHVTFVIFYMMGIPKAMIAWKNMVNRTKVLLLSTKA